MIDDLLCFVLDGSNRFSHFPHKWLNYMHNEMKDQRAVGWIRTGDLLI